MRMQAASVNATSAAKKIIEYGNDSIWHVTGWLDAILPMALKDQGIAPPLPELCAPTSVTAPYLPVIASRRFAKRVQGARSGPNV
jgi:hypothetical protein